MYIILLRFLVDILGGKSVLTEPQLKISVFIEVIIIFLIQIFNILL
jgi:hypothetical protein